jgi:Fic-DOC domain mobile mystery protein B
MGLDLNYIEGQTPLSEEEKEGLKLRTVENRTDLDEAEQSNIVHAIEWTLHNSPKLPEILSEDYIKKVHKKMFGEVWKWAGAYRKTNKNLGVDKFEISTELRKVFDDCAFWIEHNTFSEEEIAIRFKHRIVLVHPFANGNGRHSRLLGDILISKFFRQPVFSWGSRSLIKKGEARASYLAALHKADEGNYQDLITFARN